MRGEFFFSGHGKLSVTTSYGGPPPTRVIISQVMCFEYLEGTDKIHGKSKMRKPFLVVSTLWPQQCKFCQIGMQPVDLDCCQIIKNAIAQETKSCGQGDYAETFSMCPSKTQEKYRIGLECSGRSWKNHSGSNERWIELPLSGKNPDDKAPE